MDETTKHKLWGLQVGSRGGEDVIVVLFCEELVRNIAFHKGNE